MALQYLEAGQVVEAVLSGSTSLKAAVYAKGRKTPLDKSVLDDIIESTNLGAQTASVSSATPSMLRVMVYDLLFGKHKSVVGGGALKRIITENENAIRSALARLKMKKKVQSDEDLIPDHLRIKAVIPRYVRVNLLRTAVDTVISKFTADGWIEVSVDDVKHLLEATVDPTTGSGPMWPRSFWRDPHLADLLVFPPSTDFHNDPLLKSGDIILQDKASALGGACLQPPADPTSVALDGCSAPGQKTAQLAQSLQNMGTLLATEQDPARYRTLTRLAKLRGLRNLTAFNQSFLDIDPQSAPFSSVQYILLDPSCSGSGIVNRLDFSSSGDAEMDSAAVELAPERLRSLSEFQLSVIQHAFKFPQLKRLVYSTCSVHEIENEQVVMRALESAPPGWHLVKALPQFPSRGRLIFPQGDLCIRTDPVIDHTIGFFVACFERDPACIPAPLPSSLVETTVAGLQKVQQPIEERARRKRSRSQVNVAPVSPAPDQSEPAVKKPKLTPAPAVIYATSPSTFAKLKKKKKKQMPKPIIK